jgi:AAA domain
MNFAALTRPRDIDGILDQALAELRDNAEKPALQLAAIQLAAQRLHPFGDAAVEARDIISEVAQDCGLDTDEIQRHLSRGVEQAELRQPDKQQRARRFQLIPFRDLKPLPKPAYLIKGVFPRIGLIVVWGPPKCGKSFWVTDAMLHVALGWEYRSHRVARGSVVYCALEGQEGYGKRAEAFRRRHLAEVADPVPFYLVAARMNLVKEHAPLISAIKAEPLSPAVVVLDTLNRSLDGSESDDRDMAAYIKAADAIREEFNCAVIIVHHSGVDASRPRGHTSLTGAVDAQIKVMRDAAGNIVAEVEWMKDGPEGEIIVSRLEVVEVGVDADDDSITSCIVVAADGRAIPKSIKPSKWSKSPLCKALMTTIDSGCRVRPCRADGPSVSAVALEAVRREFYKIYPAENQAAKQKAWARALKAAAEDDLIGIREVNDTMVVWFACDPGQPGQLSDVAGYSYPDTGHPP